MRRLLHPFVAGLVLWTLLVWTTRIRNVWTDAALAAGEQWARTALAGSFTLLAGAVAVALARQAGWLRTAVGVLGTWTVLVWAVRAAGIVTAGHEAGFVAVHLVLALVSATLAALAWREVAPRRAEPATA